MVLLRKKLENINLKYEKILRIINTIFNILWVLVYSIYFIISFYLLDFQLSYVLDFLQILLGFIFIFNSMNMIYFMLIRYTKFKLSFINPLNILVKILAFLNMNLLLYISIFKSEFLFYNHFLTLFNYSYIIFLSFELFFILYNINDVKFKIKDNEFPKNNDVNKWFDNEYFGYSLQLKEFLNRDVKDYIKTNHENLQFLEEFIFSKFPTENDLIREKFLLEKNKNIDINSFELISKAINKGVTIAIAFIVKTGLISTIIISSFISAVFATIRLILTSIAVKISLFIGKNNITKAEDLKTYLKVGFLVFLIMILILALDNLSLIIKNSIKNKKNRKYKENYLKLVRYICDNYDCLKNRGK